MLEWKCSTVIVLQNQQRELCWSKILHNVTSATGLFGVNCLAVSSKPNRESVKLWYVEHAFFGRTSCVHHCRLSLRAKKSKSDATAIRIYCPSVVVTYQEAVWCCNALLMLEWHSKQWCREGKVSRGTVSVSTPKLVADVAQARVKQGVCSGMQQFWMTQKSLQIWMTQKSLLLLKLGMYAGLDTRSFTVASCLANWLNNACWFCMHQRVVSLVICPGIAFDVWWLVWLTSSWVVYEQKLLLIHRATLEWQSLNCWSLQARVPKQHDCSCMAPFAKDSVPTVGKWCTTT